jgi:hypothetical protein
MPSRDFMVNRQLPWIEHCIYLKPPELSLAHQKPHILPQKIVKLKIA